MNSNSLYAIILCGGSGTRLWPLSRSQMPKQLLPINGDKTLLQQTALRICKKIHPKNLITVTNDNHYYEVKGQLSEISHDAVSGVICEPFAKNTLPAIALAVNKIYQEDPDAVVGIFPSDHSIDDEDAFLQAWDLAEKNALDGYLTLFGIRPTEPATGYGYIKPGKYLDHGGFQVDAFVEKPDLTNAKSYVDHGYYWNGGMFVFKVERFMAILSIYQPEIYSKIISINQDNISVVYSDLPSISVDYGIFEIVDKVLDKVSVVPVDMSWSDLGNWESVYQRHEKNDSQNVLSGKTLTLETSNSILWADSGVITTLGVDNLIVIRTADVTMVCNRDRSEDVKLLVNEVNSKYPKMAESHLTVQRPWGSYTILEDSEQFKIKRIVVNPNHKLSLQSHAFRSEHWIIVKGIATVTNDVKEYTLETNQSTYIPSGNRHRLENRTNQELILIEVQTGSYLGEDDIVRFDDIYGR